MFKKVRFIHHIGRFYFKPLTSAAINESFRFATENYPHLKSAELAQIGIQFLNKHDFLDPNGLTKSGRDFLLEVQQATQREIERESTQFKQSPTHRSKNQFKQLNEILDAKIRMKSVGNEDHIRAMNIEEVKNFLAYELGILEYNTIIHGIVKDPMEEMDEFVNFLKCYLAFRYPQKQDIYLEYWLHLIYSGERMDYRKKGIDDEINARDETGKMRAGYYPGATLKDVMGWT